MKINCDKVLTIDNFDVAYASWKGRTLTVMGDYIKVCQFGIQSRYYDTIYFIINLKASKKDAQEKLETLKHSFNHSPSKKGCLLWKRTKR